MARLLERYRDEIRPSLMERWGLSNVYAAPQLDRIVVNMGVGEGSDDKARLDAAVGDLAILTGQQPLITKAKKSISGFKLREGMSVGSRS